MNIIQLPPDTAGRLAGAVGDVMAIDAVTQDKRPPGSIRLEGHLLLPPDEAYGMLAERFKPFGVTPLLRKTKDGRADEVEALPVAFGRATQRVGLALGLFVLTVISCLFVGAQLDNGGPQLNWNLLDGWPFAASLMAILTAHEFGHYLTARHLGTPTSLPYFIPMPIGLLGTMGAFIKMSMPPRNRRHLLAVGAAGPLAGLVVAVPVLWLGLKLSHVAALPLGPYAMEGNSLLYVLLKYMQFGRLLPSGGLDVQISQVAFAGWGGLLVTGLNLMPAGQLDGGHIVYALLGPKGARIATWIVMVGLAALIFVWSQWAVWLVLVAVFGRFQDMPLDDITQLTRGQRVLAVGMVAVFVLVFSPVPWLQFP